jgi:hypothetical protein
MYKNKHKTVLHTIDKQIKSTDEYPVQYQNNFIGSFAFRKMLLNYYSRHNYKTMHLRDKMQMKLFFFILCLLACISFLHSLFCYVPYILLLLNLNKTWDFTNKLLNHNLIYIFMKKKIVWVSRRKRKTLKMVSLFCFKMENLWRRRNHVYSG